MDAVPQPTKVQTFRDISAVEHLIANIFAVDPQMRYFSLLIMRRTQQPGLPIPAGVRTNDEADLIMLSDECRIGEHVMVDMFHRANVKDLNMVVGSSYSSGIEPIPNEALTFLLTYAPDEQFGRMHAKAPTFPAIALFCAVGQKLYHYSSTAAKDFFDQLPVRFQNFQYVRKTTPLDLLPYLETPWTFLNKPLATDAILSEGTEESRACVTRIREHGIVLAENPDRVFGMPEYEKIKKLVFESYFRWLNNGCEHVAYFNAGIVLGVPRTKAAKIDRYLKLRDWMNCARSGHVGIEPETFPKACFHVEYPDPVSAAAEPPASDFDASDFIGGASEEQLSDEEQPLREHKFDPYDHASPHAPRFISYNFLHTVATEVIEELQTFFMTRSNRSQPAWAVAIGLDRLINEEHFVEHILTEIGDRECAEAVEFYERHYRSII